MEIRLDPMPAPQAALPSLDARYEVVRRISEGGACVVHEAVHRATGRRVAVKVLRHELRTQPLLVDRLRREGRVLSRARHPGVVDVLDAGVCVAWGPYLVLELLEGRTLEAILAARQRLTLAETAAIAAQVASALAFGHARGVVHRDVKPANVVVARREDGVEMVKLVDYGLARLTSGDEAMPEGERLGTAGYAAPEQWSGAQAGAPADVYALGVTMFECLAGDLPGIPGPAPRGRRTPSEVSIATLPSDLTQASRDALGRALEPDPARRFADPRELVRALAGTLPIAPHTSLLGLDNESRSELPARRAFPRAPYRTPARITTPSGAIDGHVADVSEGGVQVVAQRPCPEMPSVRVRMAMPLRGEVVALEAKVRWSRSHRGLHAVGLEFVDLPREARDAIARYVAMMGEEPSRAKVTTTESTAAGRCR